MVQIMYKNLVVSLSITYVHGRLVQFEAAMILKPVQVGICPDADA